MSKQRLEFAINIHASRERVWKALLDDASFREWCGVFMPGSYAVSDWSEGSEVKFLDPRGQGLQSHIEKHTPNDNITFVHKGVIEDNSVSSESDEAKKWVGLSESYSVSSEGDHTKLTIQQEVADEYADWFSATWVKALEKIKEMSEAN